MKKIGLIILILIVGGGFGGCIQSLSQTAGSGFVEGVKTRIISEADKIALQKNKAALNQAVSQGAPLGLTYNDIDSDGDGLFSDKEAVQFSIAVIKAELKDDGAKIIQQLKDGDLAGAKQTAKDTRDQLADKVLGGLMSLIAMAAGTYKYTMWRRDGTSPDRVKKVLAENGGSMPAAPLPSRPNGGENPLA